MRELLIIIDNRARLIAVIYIQHHLIVSKDHFNSLGKYNYRNPESILSATKTLISL